MISYLHIILLLSFNLRSSKETKIQEVCASFHVHRYIQFPFCIVISRKWLHIHTHTRVLARARGGPRACIYVYLLEERPLDDAWAARTRSILFAAQFSRIDISSGVSRRSTTMSSNSTVVNVSKSYPREGWARGKTAGSFPLSILFAFSSPLSSMTFLPASYFLSSCSSSSLFVIFFDLDR